MLPQEQQEHHMLEHHMLPQEEHQMLPEAACDQLITHQDHRLALGEDSRGSAASSSAGGSSAANAAKGWCCKHQDKTQAKTQAKTHQDKTRNGASTPGYFWWVVLVCYMRAARLLHAGSCFALGSPPHLLCACCILAPPLLPLVSPAQWWAEDSPVATQRQQRCPGTAGTAHIVTGSSDVTHGRQQRYASDTFV